MEMLLELEDSTVLLVFPVSLSECSASGISTEREGSASEAPVADSEGGGGNFAVPDDPEGSGGKSSKRPGSLVH